MYILNYIESNPLFLGICGLMNSFGVRLLWDDLNEYDKNWLYNSNLKKLVIFTIIFITTRDLLISIILFILYLIIFQPEFYKKIFDNNNNDNVNQKNKNILMNNTLFN